MTDRAEHGRTKSGVATGPAPTIPPKWKRELRLLRRDGLRKYLRGAWLLHRFHRSMRRLPHDRATGGGAVEADDR